MAELSSVKKTSWPFIGQAGPLWPVRARALGTRTLAGPGPAGQGRRVCVSGHSQGSAPLLMASLLFWQASEPRVLYSVLPFPSEHPAPSDSSDTHRMGRSPLQGLSVGVGG